MRNIHIRLVQKIRMELYQLPKKVHVSGHSQRLRWNFGPMNPFRSFEAIQCCRRFLTASLWKRHTPADGRNVCLLPRQCQNCLDSSRLSQARWTNYLCHRIISTRRKILALIFRSHPPYIPTRFDDRETLRRMNSNAAFPSPKVIRINRFCSKRHLIFHCLWSQKHRIRLRPTQKLSVWPSFVPLLGKA